MNAAMTRPTAGATGMLAGISLPATLQMLNAERRDCVIEVDSFGDHGELVLENGEIIAAQAGIATGTPAALQILQWPDVTVRIQSARGDAERDIFQPLHQLLMDSYRLEDEHHAATGDGTGPDTPALVSGTDIDDAFDTLLDRASTDYDYARLLTKLATVPGILTAKVFDLDQGIAVQRPASSLHPETTPFWEADELTRQQLSLLMTVTTAPGVRDGLIMYDTCAHLFRPVTGDALVFAYLTLDAATGNLVAARNAMRSLQLQPRGDEG